MSLRVLLVTDLTYPAQGRRYCDEDIRLSGLLREHVTLSLCHPLDAEALLESADVVLVRNTGPVIHYLDAYASFRRRALDLGVRLLPELSGRADQVGKDYLLELFAEGLPVISTVARIEDIELLPPTSQTLDSVSAPPAPQARGLRGGGQWAGRLRGDRLVSGGPAGGCQV